MKRVRALLDRLDDNFVSQGLVDRADSTGWWWNLGLGGLLLLAGIVALFVSGHRSAAVPLMGMGTASMAVGWAMLVGKRRRQETPDPMVARWERVRRDGQKPSG